MNKASKERLAHDAEALRERQAAADREVDSAGRTLDELVERSAEAEVSYRADTAARRRALARRVAQTPSTRG